MRCVCANLVLLLYGYNVVAGPLRRSLAMPMSHQPYVEPRQDGGTDLEAIFRSLDRARGKYDVRMDVKRRSGTVNGTQADDVRPASLTRRLDGFPAQKVTVPMLSSRLDHKFDVERTPFVRIGVKGVSDQFTVIFDTGSIGLALPGQYCMRGCNGKRYPNTGQDLKVTEQVLYSGGQIAQGEYYSDDVTVGGVTAEAQRLLSITQCDGFYQTTDTRDTIGVMGFGFNRQDEFFSYDSVFQNLISQGALEAPEASFYFSRIRTLTVEGSTLTLGGRDPSKYFGDLTTVPVSPGQPFWRIPVDTVRVHGIITGLNTRLDAIVDTGSSWILAPLATLRSIFHLVPWSFEVPRVQLDTGASPTVFFAYRCDTDPNIELRIAGRNFKISLADMKLAEITEEFRSFDSRPGSGFFYSDEAKRALDYAHSEKFSFCLATIVGSNTLVHDHYVLGLAFLRSYVSIFSLGAPPTVTFAENRDNLDMQMESALGLVAPPVDMDWHGPAETNDEAAAEAKERFIDAPGTSGPGEVAGTDETS